LNCQKCEIHSGSFWTCHLIFHPQNVTLHSIQKVPMILFLPSYTVQKRQRLRFVPHMQVSFYVTDTISIASFLADFYVLSTSASLEYIEYAGMLLPLLIAYSSDADTDSALKSAKNEAILIVSVTYKILSRCMRETKSKCWPFWTV
jgi:hypothetical protein